ncbi:MAG: hypothetical protein ACYDDF_07830 [Thermoplasmatota archaeon]
MNDAASLSQPGLVGRGIRLVLGVVVVLILVTFAVALRDVLAGGPTTLAPGLLFDLAWVAATWPYVLGKMIERDVGWKASAIPLASAALAGALWVLESHGPWFANPWLDVVLFLWAGVWAILFGPALLLAAALRTPGCEMRSYADLAARLHGEDPRIVACPGWVDKWDGVRVFGN